MADVSHVLAVDPDEVVAGQNSTVASEGAARRDGTDDESVGAVVFDINLGEKSSSITKKK
jgi:hypothetical protein